MSARTVAVFLIRPDGYVGFAAQVAEPGDALAQNLDAQLGVTAPPAARAA